MNRQRENPTSIPPPTSTPTLRRSTRTRKPPKRLGYDGQQGRGYLVADASVHLLPVYAHMSLRTPLSYKATKDPDTLSYEEAMQEGPEQRHKWKMAAQKEISTLESKGTWVEDLVSNATTKILPGTWVFRRKRTPDGTVSKYKARYCVRGDLQEGEHETFAPVVAWSSIRLFLVLALTLDWYTCTIDFASAFVQATLKQGPSLDPPPTRIYHQPTPLIRQDMPQAQKEPLRFVRCSQALVRAPLRSTSKRRFQGNRSRPMLLVQRRHAGYLLCG